MQRNSKDIRRVQEELALPRFSPQAFGMYLGGDDRKHIVQRSSAAEAPEFSRNLDKPEEYGRNSEEPSGNLEKLHRN